MVLEIDDSAVGVGHWAQLAKGALLQVVVEAVQVPEATLETPCIRQVRWRCAANVPLPACAQKWCNSQ